MVPVVLVLQLLKRFGVCPASLDEATINNVFDLLSACAGIYGLYYALHSDPAEIKKKVNTVSTAEKPNIAP
jgi:hypothetical protein